MPRKKFKVEGGGSLLDSMGQDYGCVPGRVVVGRDVDMDRLLHHSRTSLVQMSGAKHSYAFACYPEARGWHNLSLVVESEAKRASWHKLGGNVMKTE